MTTSPRGVLLAIRRFLRSGFPSTIRVSDPTVAPVCGRDPPKARVVIGLSESAGRMWWPPPR